MLNIGGKGSIKVVERHIVEKPAVGPTLEEHQNLIGRLAEVEKRKPEVRHDEMTDALLRIGILEKQVGAAQEDILDTQEAIKTIVVPDMQLLEDEIDKLKARPAQVVSTNTIEKPGLTVHEKVIKQVTPKYIWVLIGILSVTQIVLIGILL